MLWPEHMELPSTMYIGTHMICMSELTMPLPMPNVCGIPAVALAGETQAAAVGG